jgi:RNA polymerase sigma-32 factor
MASSALYFEISPQQNLSRYLQTIRKYPMLEPKEEASLARRWRDEKDRAAADKIVTSHLRLVAKIAMGYRGYGLPIGEMISEGNLGMMRAVERFDPERGFRVSTYAIWWIRAAIQEYILRSWSLVKMGTTAAQKKLFFNLRSVKGRMSITESGDLSPENVTAIKTALGVPEGEVINMNRRMSGGDQSLNAPLGEDGNGQWQDILEDGARSQEESLAKDEEMIHRRGLLQGAMKGLSERECDIFKERRLKDSPTTLEKLSQVYGISRERVRQIEAKAFEKVRKSIHNTVIEQKIVC